MDYRSLVASCVVGICLGVAYGYLFMFQHRLRPAAPKKIALIAVTNAARLLAFALIWYFILKTPLLKSILVLTVFFVSFWVVILSAKGRQ